MSITDGATVYLEYELYYTDEEGTELIEEATVENPMNFIFMQDPMLAEFEKAMEGLKEGDTFDFVIKMDNAYGPYLDERIAEFPKSDFIVEGELDEEALEEGNIVPMKDEEENEYEAYVLENTLNTIVLDFNHPLAGGDLRFKGSVIKIEWPAHKNN